MILPIYLLKIRIKSRSIKAIIIQNQEKSSESTRSIVAKSITPEDDFVVSTAKTSETRKTQHNPRKTMLCIRFFDVFLVFMQKILQIKIMFVKNSDFSFLLVSSEFDTLVLQAHQLRT